MADLPLLVFDVNETLLDLETLTPHFVRLFRQPSTMREWFAQLILYSEAITLTGNYLAFGELGGAVLRMLGKTRGVQVSDDDVAMLKEAVATMPAHADVRSALATLRAANFRLFTLTNNPNATCVKQLRHANIADLFEQNFSVDEGVHRYKPALEVYRAVEASLGVIPDQLCLVACHTWDILGASAAGWKTALIRRSGNAVLDVGGQPLIKADNLHEITRLLLARFAG